MENKIEFVCKNCGYSVSPLKIGTRNHCTKCLYSLHVDIFPNDNANTCRNLMKPESAMQNANGEVMIIHKCTFCDKTSRAKVELDDNYEEVLKLL